jgi:putative transposase
VPGSRRVAPLVSCLAAPTRAERVARREALVADIREIFEASRQRYGAPRVHADLQTRGRRISKRTVAKLMKQNGIRPLRGKRRVPITTDSRHAHAVAPNLLDRNFEIAVPDAVWLADISYIPTEEISYIPTEEGWLYLAAVKDLATMEIVGWSMSDRLKSTLCEDALKMAMRNRRPPRGLIQHSERGVQYACTDYRKLLEANGLKASMSRKGNCLDNAPPRQRPDGELLRCSQDRTRASHAVPNAARGEGRALRIHRGLRQPATPPFERRIPNTSAGKNRHDHG